MVAAFASVKFCSHFQGLFIQLKWITTMFIAYFGVKSHYKFLILLQGLDQQCNHILVLSEISVPAFCVWMIRQSWNTHWSKTEEQRYITSRDVYTSLQETSLHSFVPSSSSFLPSCPPWEKKGFRQNMTWRKVALPVVDPQFFRLVNFLVSS